MDEKALDFIEIIMKDKKQNFTHIELYELIKEKMNFDKKNKKETLTSLYLELIHDNRFFLDKNKKWMLRENSTLDNINNGKKTHIFTSEIDNFSISIKNVTLSDDVTEGIKELGIRTKKRGFKNDVEYSERIKDNIGKLNNSNKTSLSSQIGVTEEIDWNNIENEINENN